MTRDLLPSTVTPNPDDYGAVSALLLRLAEVVYAPFYALFVVGSIAMVIDISRESQSSHRPSSEADLPARDGQ